MNKKTAVIVGAGFSYVAGLPLAQDLFAGDVFASSRAAGVRYQRVLRAWEAWSATHDGGPEQFLSEVYRTDPNGRVPWLWAAEFVAAVLATPRAQDQGAFQFRYAGRITRPVNAPIHSAFWDVVLSSFDVAGVVTTNYDILVERGLRHRCTTRPPRPGFYYGGLPKPQILKGAALPFSAQQPLSLIELGGGVPVYKLHGSLNWGTDSGQLVIYQDLRPAFRRGGDARIVPPVEEKKAPEWLSGVWQGARKVLERASTWIVCGYSLPEYDVAVRELFSEAGLERRVTTILLIDPFAASIADRWRAVAPDAEIRCLPGLPQALNRIAL
jgi:hypothetical protein